MLFAYSEFYLFVVFVVNSFFQYITFVFFKAYFAFWELKSCFMTSRFHLKIINFSLT